MNFNFLNPNQISISKFNYRQFDEIVGQMGYEIEKDAFLYTFFSWKNMPHWAFDHEKIPSEVIKNSFLRSEACEENNIFYIRLTSDQPIIEVEANALAEMLEDLVFETGMGWEGISKNGKFILEFRDSYEHQARSNFEILPHTEVKNAT